MNLDLSVTGEGGRVLPDELVSLRAWLVEEEELRGRVEMTDIPPAPDRLGPVLDVLQVAVGPAAAALSAVLVAWIRSRVGSVRLVVRSERGDSVEVAAKNVRELDADEVRELTERLTRLAEGGGTPQQELP